MTKLLEGELYIGSITTPKTIKVQVQGRFDKYNDVCPLSHKNTAILKWGRFGGTIVTISQQVEVDECVSTSEERGG